MWWKPTLYHDSCSFSPEGAQTFALSLAECCLDDDDYVAWRQWIRLAGWSIDEDVEQKELQSVSEESFELLEEDEEKDEDDEACSCFFLRFFKRCFSFSRFSFLPFFLWLFFFFFLLNSSSSSSLDEWDLTKERRRKILINYNPINMKWGIKHSDVLCCSKRRCWLVFWDSSSDSILDRFLSNSERSTENKQAKKETFIHHLSSGVSVLWGKAATSHVAF